MFPVDVSFLGWLVAIVATWLIGVNTAIVYRFWPEQWLSLKLFATSGLLVYCALSVLYGQPAQWRVMVGLCAIAVDAGAIVGIWHAMHKAEKGDGVLIAYRRR